MQGLILALLLTAVVAQPYCNSFVQSGSYYDVNLGQKADRQVAIPEVSATTVFTYNHCGSVATVCEVLVPSGTNTIVQNYEVLHR